MGFDTKKPDPTEVWTLLFEKAVLPVAVALELLLQQSDSDPLSNLQLYELLPLTYQDSNYPFERDIGYF